MDVEVDRRSEEVEVEIEEVTARHQQDWELHHDTSRRES